MKVRWSAVLLLLVGVAYGLGIVSWASASTQDPCTITVRPGESIQEAIDSASPGDVIFLAKGTWHENLVIKKSLTLRGARGEESVIKGREEDKPVILVESDSGIEVVIEELAVAEAKGDRHGDGIEIAGEAKVTVRDSRIWGNSVAGVRVGGSAQANISNSQILLNEFGMSMGEYSQAAIFGSLILRNIYGISVGNSSRITITRSQVSGNYMGISMEGVSQVAISNSEISANKDVGIFIDGSSQAEISSSKIHGNGKDGISVSGSSRATISDSKVLRNGWSGISIGGSSHVEISGSEISGNGWGGIVIWHSPEVIWPKPEPLISAAISGSVISKNGWSGILMTGSFHAVIRDNEITGNGDYGVALEQPPCYDVEPTGLLNTVEGDGNVIHDNGKGEVCPSDLEFLLTEEGGCYGALCKGG